MPPLWWLAIQRAKTGHPTLQSYGAVIASLRSNSKPVKTMTRIIITLLMALACVPTAPAATQSLKGIEAAVTRFVSADLAGQEATTFQLGRLDPRLRLPQCDRPLDAEYTHNRPNQVQRSVEVRCESATPWSLYVPVTFERHADVVVMTRSVRRGEVLTEADLRVERRSVQVGSAAFFDAPTSVIGLVANRDLITGQALNDRHVRPPRLVRRGDHVTLSSGGKRGISVTVRAEALADGAAGDRIAVRNLRSKRVVQGTVNAAGEVVVRTIN